MELTPDQEREIKAIMAETDCFNGFKCYEAGFEDLCPVRRYFGANIIRCLSVNRQRCPMSQLLCDDVWFCRCALRRYVAFQFGR